MIELSLPAGSMQAALAAFDGGADSVYLGLERYSARAAAANFSFEELSALRAFCIEHKKRCYVTLNTLLDEESLPAIVPTLRRLSFIGCDGVIVQDLGLARLIKRHFPTLPLHASTQLAVHTTEGVNELARLGFVRVVLARELTREEIAAIRRACPDIELKVFIHGSLCYSVSGACMASAQITGRSANEGSCAQICRSYFTVEADETVSAALSPLGRGPRTAWFFSMSDLFGGPAIRNLEAIGIESVKVEGRMKGPLYTRAAAQYYRALLDGSGDVDSLEDALAIAFSRRHTGGWLTGYGRQRQDFSIRTTATLGSISYPGHRGVRAATVRADDESGVWVESERPLSLRDGLLYFTPGDKEPVEAVRFGIRGLWDEEGRPVTTVAAHTTALIALPAKERWPRVGEQLFLISAHDQNLALYSDALPAYKKPITITVTIDDECVTVSAWGIERRYHLCPQEAEQAQDVAENLERVFSRSGDSPFFCEHLEVVNRTERALSSLFLPMSRLNEIRRNFYAELDAHSLREMNRPLDEERERTKIPLAPLPPRSALVSASGLCFLDLQRLRKAASNGEPLADLLFQVDGFYYLPLPVVMFREERFAEDLDAVIATLTAEGIIDCVRFGLNNIGQIPLFRERGLSCWADVYLYLSNSESAQSLVESGLRLVGGYLWMERSRDRCRALAVSPDGGRQRLHRSGLHQPLLLPP
ncbi:MAG: peptidase U32 family protein [Sphaerochaeta sp.]